MNTFVAIPGVREFETSYCGGHFCSIDLEAQTLEFIDRKITEQCSLSADHFKYTYTIKSTVIKYVVGSSNQPPTVEDRIRQITIDMTLPALQEGQRRMITFSPEVLEILPPPQFAYLFT